MNQKLLNAWIEQNQPHAVEKLAIASRCSSRLIRMMMTGYAPKRPAVRWTISHALGVSENDLFPAPSKRKT